MARRFGSPGASVPPREVEGNVSDNLYPVGPLWFSQRALDHARSAYLGHELAAGAELWGVDFITGPLSQTLRGLNRQPLTVSQRPDGTVLVRHPDEAEPGTSPTVPLPQEAGRSPGEGASPAVERSYRPAEQAAPALIQRASVRVAEELQPVTARTSPPAQLHRRRWLIALLLGLGAILGALALATPGGPLGGLLVY